MVASNPTSTSTSTSTSTPTRPHIPQWMQGTTLHQHKINTTTHPLPFNLQQWIDDNRPLLKPPVGNKMINSDDCQFKVMIVGGPNTRTDYHIEDGEEWFYMVEGSMVLKIVDGGVFRDVVIHQGESFLLPANVPHSPQRPANSIGLVIERDRPTTWSDGLRWYCRSCHAITTQHKFHCTNLGVQLVPLIKQYYGSDQERTCTHCGAVDRVPTAELEGQQIVDIIAKSKQPESKEQEPEVKAQQTTNKVNSETHPPPFHLQQQINSHIQELTAGGVLPIYNQDAQFKISVHSGPSTHGEYHIAEGEEWFWQLKGDAQLKVVDGGEFKTLAIPEGNCFLLPARIPHAVQRSPESIGIVVARERSADEIDGVRWYCQNPQCHNILHTVAIQTTDGNIGAAVKPIVAEWYAEQNRKQRTCTQCGTVDVWSSTQTA